MIYIIGDTQSKAGVRNPLKVIAKHIANVKPSHIIHLGDHWDLPSLSYWDKGKRSHTISASYQGDMEAANSTMDEFWIILLGLWPEAKKDCVSIILQGNHEDRRAKALEKCDPEYHELINEKKFNYNNWDLIVPFLEVIRIHGIEFSHFFQNDGSARPISNAKALLNKRHVSCIAGHKQGFDYAEQLKGKDQTIQAMIVGSSYYHDEGYKTHTNHHFRGTVVLFIEKEGDPFDYARFSLDLLDKFFKE